MWLYFSQNGTLVRQLTHGTPARQGTAGSFDIFAYFQNINLSNYSTATISFTRPDGTIIETTYFMDYVSSRKFVKLEDETSIYPFIENANYNGFSYTVNDPSIFSQFGLYKATIRLYNGSVQLATGLATINVSEAVYPEDYDISVSQWEELVQKIATKQDELVEGHAIDINQVTSVISVDESELTTKQDTLVSGTNIKTINGQNLLGSGNIVISTSGLTPDKGISIDAATQKISVNNGAGLEFDNDNKLKAKVDGQGIIIDNSGNIAPNTDVLQVKMSDGTGIHIDENDNINVDTDVIATKNDLSSKLDKNNFNTSETSTILAKTGSITYNPSSQYTADVLKMQVVSNTDAILTLGNHDNVGSVVISSGTRPSYTSDGSTYANIALTTEIPTTINNLSGGTLTSPLNITGGDAATASKISLSKTGLGQITDESTSTLFGFLNSSELTVGGSSTNLRLRGNESRPKYNGNDIALSSDITPFDGCADVKVNGNSILNANKILTVDSSISETSSNNPATVNAIKDFVNSSVSTATGTFRGNYNVVSDLNLQYNATDLQISAALESAISSAANNDYCFVSIPSSQSTPTNIVAIKRFKYATNLWVYEYVLNNSSFTQAQWATINSGLTSSSLDAYAALAGNNEFTGNNKFTHTIDLSDDTPFVLSGFGTGTYNKGAIVCNQVDKFGFECPRETDSPTGTIVPFRIGARGGQLGILQAGDMYQNNERVMNVSGVTNSNSSFNLTTDSSHTIDIVSGHNLTLGAGSGKKVTIKSANRPVYNTGVSGANDVNITLASDLTGAISNVTGTNLTANRTLISDANGKIAVSDITSTELNYLDNVSSNIQTQLDGKLNLSDESLQTITGPTQFVADVGIVVKDGTAGTTYTKYKNGEIIIDDGVQEQPITLTLPTSAAGTLATENYVTTRGYATQAQLNTKLSLGGGTMSGEITFDVDEGEGIVAVDTLTIGAPSGLYLNSGDELKIKADSRPQFSSDSGVTYTSIALSSDIKETSTQIYIEEVD